MTRLLALLTIFLTLPAAAQPNIVGEWSGSIDLSEVSPGAGSLTVVFHISGEDDVYTGTLDSPDQGAFGLPLSEIEFDGEGFSASLAAASASYSGMINEEGTVILGRWTQGGNTMLLVLAPYEAPATPASASATKPTEIKPGDYSGDWAGVMAMDSGGEIHMTFRLSKNEDGSYNAVLDAPGQADNMALGQISVYGREVEIDIMGQASYTGTISNDERSMEGSFEQGGDKSPMTLTRR